MKSQIVKRSVVIAAHKKSISLEEIVWRSLKRLPLTGDMTLVALLATIDSRRNQGNLFLISHSLIRRSTFIASNLKFKIGTRP